MKKCMSAQRRIIVIFAVLLAACSLPTDPGPMPKDIIDTEFEPSYNVLGILRNDGEAGTSFFRVERIYKIEEALDEFTPVIDGVDVSIVENTTTDKVEFTGYEDSLKGKIYANPTFLPEGGKEYNLSITSGDFPDVSGDVIVPMQAFLDSSSVEISWNSVEFALNEAETISLYDVYLIGESGSVSVRQYPATTGSTLITVSLPVSMGTPQQIEIYGYDRNMAEYVTAPITIKPQTYRETVTSVTGGYGVFGAVSVMRYAFQ